LGTCKPARPATPVTCATTCHTCHTCHTCQIIHIVIDYVCIFYREYGLLIFLAIVLVRTLSYNIQRQLISNEDNSHKKQWPVLVSTIVVLILALISSDNIYVTDLDQYFFWGTILYTIFYLIFHVCEVIYTYNQDQPMFNIIAGALQLIAMRIYCGSQSPYNDVVLCMICTRMW